MEAIQNQLGGKLRIAAIGATVAMVPVTLLMFLLSVEAIKDMKPGIVLALYILQFLGCLVWGGALLSSVSDAIACGMKSGIIKALGWMAMIGALIHFFAILGIIDIMDNSSRYYSGPLEMIFGSQMAGISVLGFLQLNMMMWVLIAFMGQGYKGLNLAKIGYIIIAFLPYLAMLLIKALIDSSEAVLMLFVIVFIAGVALAVAGWWIFATNVGGGQAVEIEASAPIFGVNAEVASVESTGESANGSANELTNGSTGESTII